MNNKGLIGFIVVAVLIVTIPLMALTYWFGYKHGHEAGYTEINKPPELSGMAREKILKMLPDKTWYMHWERKNRDRPVTFNVSDKGNIVVNETTNKMNLELLWVLKDEGHIFIPVDEHKLAGFFVATGRQKGFFADKPE